MYLVVICLVTWLNFGKFSFAAQTEVFEQTQKILEETSQEMKKETTHRLNTIERTVFGK